MVDPMNNAFPEPRIFHYADLYIGQRESAEYRITREVYGHFLDAFHDYSTLHVNDAYAQEFGYASKVMHGSIINGFLSHFVGMVFPGRYSLLLSANLSFSHPSYLGDVVRLEAVLAQKVEVRQIVVLHVKFHNLTSNCLAARGQVHILIRKEL